MKYPFLSACLIIITSLVSFGQDSSILKRSPYKLTVAVDKKTVYEEELKANPYVFPDRTVQLYPGETIYIEVEQENGVIKSMTAVKENINPAKTLIITFSQTVNKQVHESMMLKITNPFSLSLVYKAKIFLLNKRKWADTNVYPVEAGLSSFEIWPDLITSIGLSQWSFQTK